jgi:hypothetical protein
MKHVLCLAIAAALPLFAQESMHRAEQDREIRYWLLDPSTHAFRISHDFTVTRVGQASVHSFVRKGSVVGPDATMIDLDTGKKLATHVVSGKDVNALGYYPTPADPESVVVQGDLEQPVAKDRSTRVRVEETYTDPAGYFEEWRADLEAHPRPAAQLRDASRGLDADVGQHAGDDLARRGRPRAAALHQHSQR